MQTPRSVSLSCIFFWVLLLLHSTCCAGEDGAGVGVGRNGDGGSRLGKRDAAISRRQRALTSEAAHPLEASHGSIPKKLTVELYHWWTLELSTLNTSLGTASSGSSTAPLHLAPGHPTHSEFHAELVQYNVTATHGLLDAYYVLRRGVKLPTAQGWTPERSKCHVNCTMYGTCNEEFSRCDCPIGRSGPDCTTVLVIDCRGDLGHHDLDSSGSCNLFQKQNCINECNARGSCITQFCHCLPGYFGSDCSLSMGPDGRPELLAGLGYRPNASGPRMYVYELPPPLGVWRKIWVDRPVMAMLWERSLSAGFRTARHEEADVFLVPVPLRDANLHFPDVLQFLQTALPLDYLSRRGGRDHMMTSTGDWGRCERPREFKFGPHHTVATNMTVLQHWGLSMRTPNAVLDPAVLAEGFTSDTCFYTDRDILIPPNNGVVLKFLASSPYHPWGAALHYNRTNTGFFAGGICGHVDHRPPPCPAGTDYSMGVREKLYLMFHNMSDFVVESSVHDMGLQMRTSVFCFAPTGAGWGRRAAMAVMMGCIPVVISDSVVQAWEPFLDWNDFGLRVAQADLPRLLTILRALTPQQVADKQAKLECAAKHMSWSSVWGGFNHDSASSDAFGTLMAVLAARHRHPTVPDARLRSTDKVFDDFMACRSPAGAGSGGPPMCSYSQQRNFETPPAIAASVQLCPLTVEGRRFFMAGGMACAHAKDLASCIRPDLVAPP